MKTQNHNHCLRYHEEVIIMKKFRKVISGLMALSLMFASVPQVINAYDVQTNTSPKLVCSESSYADAQEITDEYIINTFLADWFKDDYCDNGLHSIQTIKKPKQP